MGLSAFGLGLSWKWFGEGLSEVKEGEGDSPLSFLSFCFPKDFLSQLVALPILPLVSISAVGLSTFPNPSPRSFSALFTDPVRGDSATMVMVDRLLGMPLTPSIGVKNRSSSLSASSSASDAALGSSWSCLFLILSKRVWSNCTLSISTSCAIPSSFLV